VPYRDDVKSHLDRYGTWLLWFGIVLAGGLILSSAAYILSSQTDYSTLGGPIGFQLHLAGFDPWTGQPYTTSIVRFDGELVRSEALPEAFVGRWAVPIPVGFVIGCVISVAALLVFRPAKVAMMAAVLLLAPLAALPIVIFTGLQTACPAGAGHMKDAVAICGTRVLESVDPHVWRATLVAIGIAWLVATVTLVIYVVRVDLRRLLQASAVAAFAAFLAAGAGFVIGAGILEETPPHLRYGVQIGIQSGIAILIVGMVIAISGSAIKARPTAER